MSNKRMANYEINNEICRLVCNKKPKGETSLMWWDCTSKPPKNAIILYIDEKSRIQVTGTKPADTAGYPECSREQSVDYLRRGYWAWYMLKLPPYGLFAFLFIVE